MLDILNQHFYTVRPGDTIFQIARRWALPIESLIAANNLEPPFIIFAGQQLSIPSGVTRYRVQQGDSIYRLSQLFGLPMSVIIDANSLNAPYVIYPEQLLNVPPGVPYYIVQPGDTLYQIAKKYNVNTAGHFRPELIQQVNQLPSINIFPGMKLIIPYVPPGEVGLIAYVSDYGGANDIWIYEPRSGVHVQLTDGLADDFTVPFWSPDSSRIAFVGMNRIVYVLHLNSGEIAQIDQLEEGEVYTLDWSPDSQRLAYTKQNNIIVYDIVSHQAQSISQPDATDVQWFPNGTEILYQAPDANGISQLFRIRINGTDKRQITRNQQGRLNYVRLSPDGTFALYTTPGVSISIIHTVDIATGQVFEVRGGPLAKNYYPEWSLDSTSIAYSATAFEELGYMSLVRTVGRRGENDRNWAISDCFATPVTWSPDSSKIVYLSGCNLEAFATQMWYLDLNHPVPIQLIDGVTITTVKWSPTDISLPRRTYTNPLYKVRFQYPLNWLKVSPERYEGVDGFFQISAIAAGPHITEVCRDEAFHPLMPYGSQPQIIERSIQNQEACFIFPSFDQAPEMREQAALIVRYPKPIQIQGMYYNYFVLWASKSFIYQIASTLVFLTNMPELLRT